MRLDYETTTGTIVITLAGDLDITEKRTVLDQVAAVLPLIGVEAVALEMSAVSSLDSDALAAMIAAQRICASQGKRLLVRRPSQSVERLLRANIHRPAVQRARLRAMAWLWRARVSASCRPLAGRRVPAAAPADVSAGTTAQTRPERLMGLRDG